MKGKDVSFACFDHVSIIERGELMNSVLKIGPILISLAMMFDATLVQAETDSFGGDPKDSLFYLGGGGALRVWCAFLCVDSTNRIDTPFHHLRVGGIVDSCWRFVVSSLGFVIFCFDQPFTIDTK